jgi:hypothetical protein
LSNQTETKKYIKKEEETANLYGLSESLTLAKISDTKKKRMDERLRDCESQRERGDERETVQR